MPTAASASVAAWIRRPIFLLVALLVAVGAHGEPAPFDLAGPNLAITVTRGDKTLPITQVPNLAQLY